MVNRKQNENLQCR